MNGTKKTILTVALTLSISILTVGGALASVWSDNAAWNGMPTGDNNLTNFLTKDITNTPSVSVYTGTVSGSGYYVTQLGYEAGDTNVLKTSSGNVLFTNTNSETNFKAATVLDHVNLTGAYFEDTTNPNTFGLTSGVDSNVQIYKLESDWKLSNGLTLGIGTLILGLNDNVGCGYNDKDFDDMIVAVSQTAPTPLPAAVWLLGSGLVGLAGFKRSRKA